MNNMLDVSNLKFSYGQSSILRGVDLVVPENKIVCLMGRNGAGKTTFMKSVMGTLKTNGGTVSLDGKNITPMSTTKRSKAGISYVPQGRGMFKQLTVYENLLMGFESLKPSRPNQETLEEMYEQFPILKTMGKRLAGSLSGGQQQQLAIARALVSKPKLLLLDEPTEGIQPSIVYEIAELLVKLRETTDMSILVVEQFLDFSRSVANDFYILETGSIVEKGDISDFTDELAKKYLSV